MLEARAAKYVMFDVTWCGGLSEAKKISTMAEAFELPVAPHTAGGPLLFYASTHLTTALTNVAIQESCQVFYETTWPTMLENPLVPHEWQVRAPEFPGGNANQARGVDQSGGDHTEYKPVSGRGL